MLLCFICAMAVSRKESKSKKSDESEALQKQVAELQEQLKKKGEAANAEIAALKVDRCCVLLSLRVQESLAALSKAAADKDAEVRSHLLAVDWFR